MTTHDVRRTDQVYPSARWDDHKMRLRVSEEPQGAQVFYRLASRILGVAGAVFAVAIIVTSIL
jgi:hypothetical protein